MSADVMGPSATDPVAIDPSAIDPAATAGTPAAPRRLTSPALLAAVGLYTAAAGHVIAALVHLEHGWEVGAFLAAAAALQVAVAGRIGRATAGPRFVGLVLAATLGLVLLYVASRTMNLPFGGVHTAHNDRPQDPDMLGTVVVMAELVTLATVPALLPDALRRLSTTAMMLVGAGIWAAWAAGLV